MKRGHQLFYSTALERYLLWLLSPQGQMPHLQTGSTIIPATARAESGAMRGGCPRGGGAVRSLLPA